MRIRVVFSLNNKGGYVPFHHQHLLSEFVRSQFEGDQSQHVAYNLYNFSGLKGQTKISRQGLHFYSSKVTLVISAPDQEYIDYLLNKIFNRDTIQIGQLYLSPHSVELEKAPELGNPVKYVCISPIVLVDPEKDNYYAKKFIPPEEDVFSDLLYDSTMNRMEQSGRYSSEEIASFYKFQIVPDKVYLKKIRERDKKFARIYTIPCGNNQAEIRGYTLPFLLYALPEVQRFVFECGLGAFANRGFGMIDIANADPVKRTSVYEPTFNPNS